MLTTLYVAPTIPRPDGFGMQKRAWSHLQSLRRLGGVRLIVLLTHPQSQAQGGDGSLAAARALSGVDATLIHVTPTAAQGLQGSFLHRLRQRLALGRGPRFQPASALDTQKLHTALHGTTYGLVFLFRTASFSTLCTWLYTSGRSVPSAVDFDDVESVALWRELRHTWRQLGGETTLMRLVDIVAQYRLELRALRQASMVSICSTVDARRLQRRRPRAAVKVIPNSVPDQAWLPPAPPHEGLRILFLGALNYEPNEDAAQFMVKTILPLLRQQLPSGVRLMIVGRAPTAAVRALTTDPAVQLHADVPDVTPFYQQADIVVAPIRFGGGTRIKIIEALSMGRPVVSTTVGAEGLGLRHGHDVLLADSAADFAQACARLARAPALRADLVAAGRRTFEGRYAEDAVCADVAAALHRLVATSGTA